MRLLISKAKDFWVAAIRAPELLAFNACCYRLVSTHLSIAGLSMSCADSTRFDAGAKGAVGGTARRPARVLILTSVMLTFIGVWSTAAVVLCDLASTAYYIGGVVEAQIGKAAPWYILAVMAFSYAVRGVYIESCSMFVRGGVYRIVHEALGPAMAKVAVSALMFDYILTGPISAVAAGQYLVRLFNQLLEHFHVSWVINTRWGAGCVAIVVVIYFYQANLRGMRASSSTARKIMWATTVMATVMIAWCLVTIAARPGTRTLPPWRPEFNKKATADGKPIINEVTGKQEDPLGWIGPTQMGTKLRPDKVEWLSVIGALGLVIAFGHSILAMSGEETLAQVYREVKAPKMTNFKWIAFIVFVYSLLITGLISFFAVMIIPDQERANFQDNLISGLALHVVGPEWARLALNALVVIVGFLILAGSVNTSIVGANGVLNRVAEDGVLPAWFQRPQRTFGTTWRLLTLIALLQAVTIVITGADVILLGEAYAFGVVWSLTLMSLSMLILRFKEPGRYRAYRVPLNIRFGRRELPLGMALIVAVLAAAAVANLLTKTVATMSGLAFTAALLAIFAATAWFHKRVGEGKGRAPEEKHLEQFKLRSTAHLTRAELGLDQPYCKLLWLTSAENLDALETCLIETDPETTGLVVVTAHRPYRAKEVENPDQEDIVEPSTGTELVPAPDPVLELADRKRMTAVINRAELAGKPVKTAVLIADDPDQAVLHAACTLDVDELIVSAAAKPEPSDRLDKLASRLAEITTMPSVRPSVRMIGKNVDMVRGGDRGHRVPPPIDDRGETARALANTAVE
jgi:amino acid transporter